MSAAAGKVHEVVVVGQNGGDNGRNDGEKVLVEVIDLATCDASTIENATFVMPGVDGMVGENVVVVASDGFCLNVDDLGNQCVVVVQGPSTAGAGGGPGQQEQQQLVCSHVDDAELLNLLKNEARRQEAEIRERKPEGDGDASGPSGGGPPGTSSLGPNKPRRRRNRKDLCAMMSVDELEAMSNQKKITEYKAPMSISEKEVRRRNRINSSISVLRKIVPGITEDTENTDVYETTAKYILFLKQVVGAAHDKAFLSEMIPL